MDFSHGKNIQTYKNRKNIKQTNYTKKIYKEYQFFITKINVLEGIWRLDLYSQYTRIFFLRSTSGT